MIYSTFLGGTGRDCKYANDGEIVVDNYGCAYVTGNTASDDFPTRNPIQATRRPGSSDVFVTKFSSIGSALVFSTYLGGDDYDDALDMVLDASRNVYILGETRSDNYPTRNALQPTNAGKSDVFIARLSAS